MYGKTAWNKGLTKETSEIVKQYSQTLRQRYADGMVDQSYKQTPEWKAKLRANAIAQGFGGYNERAGSSNSDYVYDSYGTKTYLQSSYEIQVYNELTSHGIRWSRPSYFTWVDENNITRKYFPDFYLHDYDVYLDPKNSFLIIKDFIKIKSVRDQNNINVIVFNEHHLKWESLKLLIGGSIEN